MNEIFDVAIIGGGPAASYAACRLKMSGVENVVLYERSAFPRHQIGESLLPESIPLLRNIGFLGQLENMRAVKKFGAQFHSERTKTRHRFCFNQAINSEYDYAFQVTRSSFDKSLLDHARSLGVHIRQPQNVDHWEATSDHVKINGSDHAKVVLTASGIGHRQMRPQNYLKVGIDERSALFAQYRSTATTKELSGDILINIFYPSDDNAPCWAWMIPVSDEIVSVGFILPNAVLSQMRQKSPSEKSFDSVVEQLFQLNPLMANLLTEAVLARPFELRFDFQRIAKQMAFDRELLIGDASGFIDPIFSSGVHLALKSANRAVDQILKLRENQQDYSRENLLEYEQSLRGEFWVYYRFVQMFYQRNIVERLFLAPDDYQGSHITDRIRQVTSILAGDVSTHNPMVETVLNCKLQIHPDITSLFT